MNERLIITHIGNMGARGKITAHVKVGFVECFLQRKILSSGCVRTKSTIKKKKHASREMLSNNRQCRLSSLEKPAKRRLSFFSRQKH